MGFMLCYSTQLLLLLLLAAAAGTASAGDEELFHFFDEFRHNCVRNCTAQPTPRQCEYTFRLEWYSTMSKACFGCPANMSDCFKPHCVTGDGIKRAMMSINRQLSSPGLHVCLGDTIQVTVHNHLEMGEAVSLHWHGQHMRTTPHMDGVAMISQCPINALSSFVYKFPTDPSGTHYYHAHSGMQRSEGLFGPLVVRQANDPQSHLYDLDLPQHTLLISDWMHEVGVSKFALHHYSNGDNKPKGIVINGRGAHSAVGSSSRHTPRYVLNVQAGKRYRIRVISNAILNCPFQVSVNSHSLLMIGSDGRAFEPTTVGAFIIYAGERFDFVLHANQTVGNYLINVVGLADCDTRFTSARQAAIVSYEGANADDLQGVANPSYADMLRYEGRLLNPFNKKRDANNLVVSQMRSMPADRDSSLGRVDRKFYLAFDFEKVNSTRFHNPAYYPISAVRKSDGHLYTPQINNIALTIPHAPLLYQHKDVTNMCNNTNFDPRYITQFKECSHVLSVNLNDVVELILIDKGVTFDASHPFHLHGQYFRVIGMEKVNKSVSVPQIKQMDADGLLRRNLTAPPLKDTVIVPDGGYTIVRFRASNPGPWLLHCHLEFHVEIGMGVVLLVGDPSTWSKHVPEDFPRCGPWPASKSRAQTNSNLELDELRRRNDMLQTRMQQQTYWTIAGGVLLAIACVLVTIGIMKCRASSGKKKTVYNFDHTTPSSISTIAGSIVEGEKPAK